MKISLANLNDMVYSDHKIQQIFFDGNGHFKDFMVKQQADAIVNDFYNLFVFYLWKYPFESVFQKVCLEMVTIFKV